MSHMLPCVCRKFVFDCSRRTQSCARETKQPQKEFIFSKSSFCRKQNVSSSRFLHTTVGGRKKVSTRRIRYACYGCGLRNFTTAQGLRKVTKQVVKFPFQNFTMAEQVRGRAGCVHSATVFPQLGGWPCPASCSPLHSR